MFATPKSHYFQDDDDGDSSPYSLSFSQRAGGVEVTWDEKSKSTPFKSRKNYEQRYTESPPTKTYVDVEPLPDQSPKGLFKFLIGWERRTQIEDDFERLTNETANVQNSNNMMITDTVTEYNTDADQVDGTKGTTESNSLNLKQLLNDSEDMDLMLCSQRIEEEVCNRMAPPTESIASKGFFDMDDIG